MSKTIQFFKWMGNFAEDGRSGRPSSKRVISLMAGTALSIGSTALLLAKAAWVYGHGGDIALEIAAATAPLCTLAGFNYLVGKKLEQKPEPEPEKPDEPS